MSKLQSLLTANQLRYLKTAARNGSYQILLGAGASHGARNRHGTVPMAKALVKALAEEYRQVPINTEEDTLSRAYQRAVLGTSPEAVWRFLKKVFGEVEHSAWFTDLICLPWRRVWTLNVDDAVEQAYRSSPLAPYRPARTISWDDSFSETGDLEVIHLHGHIIDAKPRKLIFSLSEYQAAAQKHVVWDGVLASAIGAKPLVVVGARLLDDPDVERLLTRNRPTAPAPSLVVDPYISPENEWELKKYGFIVYKGTAEEFTGDWLAHVGLDKGALLELAQSERLSVPQVQELQTNHPGPRPNTHRYLDGDEPLWCDAVDDLVAPLSWMQEVSRSIANWAASEEHRPGIHLIYGARLTGVSSGLLWIARNARQAGVRSYLFDRSGRFDVQRLVDKFSGHGPSVLFIDGAADFADDIDQLLSEAGLEGTAEIYVVAAELPGRNLQLEARLVGAYEERMTAAVPGRLQRRDAETLVAKREKLGRLGKLEDMDNRQRVGHFMGRDVFSAMMELEYGVGFRKRMEQEIFSLDADWKKSLILLLSIASRGRNSVSVLECAKALRVSSDTIVRAVQRSSNLGSFIEIRGDILVARQRDLLMDHIVTSMGTGGALTSLRECIQNLAPLVNQDSLRVRNRAAMLVRYAMTQKLLTSMFPNADVELFYEKLRSQFGDWNARYWEQRAIHAKHQNDWSRAESFAERAVNLLDDAFTRTTCGTILINKAHYFATQGDNRWQEFYLRGKNHFDLALSADRANGVTAFAFLQSAMSLAETARESAVRDWDGPLADLLDEWQQIYSGLRLLLGGNLALDSVRQAEALSRRWTKLTKA
ncbi:SIR2 family protein [Streptomyces sp. NPDC029216]|uniref:P-loop NTPase n=1 Tax=Streptomyces sp. NPDC029216 TaxID=3154701 RepID=UPI003410EE96